MKPSDDSLIAAYLEGDERALETLVDRYLADVYAFARTLTNDSQMAEDTAQEAFVKAWANIRGFRPGAEFRTWLFAIARNAAIDLLRKKRDIPLSRFETEEGENPLLAAVPDETLSAEALLIQAEDGAFVRRLLLQIRPEYRDVLELRYRDDLTFAAIGARLGKPLDTVKSQHRRALAALSRVLRAV